MFSCPFFLEVGVCYMSEEKIKNLLISNDLLFNQLYIFSCEFDILPNKKHNAIAIKYVDLQECREKFIEELSYIIQDWVYSRKKYKALCGTRPRRRCWTWEGTILSQHTTSEWHPHSLYKFLAV